MITSLVLLVQTVEELGLSMCILWEANGPDTSGWVWFVRQPFTRKNSMSKKMQAGDKKRNPQDATLRNINHLKKEVKKLKDSHYQLEGRRVVDIQRIESLESKVRILMELMEGKSDGGVTGPVQE